jgi:HPt (histidine-containing phosphotransfer) domain-containing protein
MDRIFSSKLEDPAVVSLLPEFNSNLKAGLDALWNGIDSENMTVVKQYCHKLGGSASIFGFELLAKRLSFLEQSAEELTKGEIELLFKDIRDLSARMESSLSQD